MMRSVVLFSLGVVVTISGIAMISWPLAVIASGIALIIAGLFVEVKT